MFVPPEVGEGATAPHARARRTTMVVVEGPHRRNEGRAALVPRSSEGHGGARNIGGGPDILRSRMIGPNGRPKRHSPATGFEIAWKR